MTKNTDTPEIIEAKAAFAEALLPVDAIGNPEALFVAGWVARGEAPEKRIKKAADDVLGKFKKFVADL